MSRALVRPVLAFGPVPLIAAGPGHVLAVDAAGVAVLAVVVVMAGLAWLALRRRYLGRGGGTIECAVRDPGHRPVERSERGWRLGVARYLGDELRWYRIFGLWPTAAAVLSRRDLEIVTRDEPSPAEHAVLGSDAVILTCRSGAGRTDIAMSRAALTGFLAWLEAAPPGAHVSYLD